VCPTQGASSAPNANLSSKKTATCQAASDCSGELPTTCHTCANGKKGCAHWTCPSDSCVLAYCPPCSCSSSCCSVATDSSSTATKGGVVCTKGQICYGGFYCDYTGTGECAASDPCTGAGGTLTCSAAAGSIVSGG
jgi:hypothetical protein